MMKPTPEQVARAVKISCETTQEMVLKGFFHAKRDLTYTEVDDLIYESTGLAILLARAESAEAERDRYKAALAMVRAHTGRLPLASRDLLDGLLSSIERITDAALAAAEVRT